MNTQLHDELKATIWEIANRLRGPYRPPQYRLVILPLYNVSPFTFDKLVTDSENIAANLVVYILGFSATARQIFEKFGFADQIEKLDASCSSTAWKATKTSFHA